MDTMSGCSNCGKETKKIVVHGGVALCKECAKENKGQWLIRTTEGNIKGPYDFIKLRSLISDKKVVFLDEVSRDGEDWELIKNIDIFKDLALKTDYSLSESTVDVDISTLKRREPKPPVFKKDKKPVSHRTPPKKRPEIMYEEDIVVTQKRPLSKWIPVFAAGAALVLFVSGLVYYSAKKTSQRNIFEKADTLSAGSDFFNKYYIKGRELEEGGLYKEALQYYHRALAAKQDHSGVRARKAAIDYLIMGNQATAGKTLQELYNDTNIGKISDQEEQCDIKNFLGIIEAKKGNYQSAYGYFNQALVIRPTNAYIYYNIGRILYKQESYVAAVEYFRNAKKLSSSFSDAALYEAVVLMRLTRFREAYQVFSDAIAQNPNVREFYTFGAYSAFKAYGADKAFNMLKKLLSLDPYYYKKEFTPLYQIDNDRSIKDEIVFVNEIIKSLGEAQKTQVGYALAILYLVDDNTDAALKLLPKDEQKSDSNAQLVSGMISFHQEHYSDAEKSINKSLELDYSSSLAHLYAGLLFLRQNDLGQSRNHFTKAQSTDEATALYAMVMLGDVLYKTKYTNEALMLWKKVISMDSHYTPAWERVLNFN
ncbi:MAG: tetratricopeptide repeat protein [Pseudomonadota bacterium]